MDISYPVSDKELEEWFKNIPKDKIIIGFVPQDIMHVIITELQQKGTDEKRNG